MQIQFSEKELEDFLCKDGNLKKYLGLRFVARQVSIPPIGIIDILAFDWDSKSWVIIELKKDLLDTSALCQGLAYLNYYKYLSNHKGNKRKFKLLLIGQNLDSSLYKNTHFFNNSLSDSWDIYYTLFSLDFASGIDFRYPSRQQQAIEDQADLLLGDCENDNVSLRRFLYNCKEINQLDLNGKLPPNYYFTARS